MAPATRRGTAASLAGVRATGCTTCVLLPALFGALHPTHDEHIAVIDIDIDLHGVHALQAQMCGVAGLVIALVLETLLFIARASGSPGLGAKYEALVDPKRWAQKQQPARPVEGTAFQTVPGNQAAQGAAEHAQHTGPLQQDVEHAEGKKDR